MNVQIYNENTENNKFFVKKIYFSKKMFANSAFLTENYEKVLSIWVNWCFSLMVKVQNKIAPRPWLGRYFD